MNGPETWSRDVLIAEVRYLQEQVEGLEVDLQIADERIEDLTLELQELQADA